MNRVVFDRDEREYRTTVRLRNGLGRWSYLVDENARPVNFDGEELRRPEFSSIHEAIAHFEKVDRIFAEWWA